MACNDCGEWKDNPFEPWKLSWWKTDCEFCIRVRFGLAGFVFGMVATKAILYLL